MIKNVSFKEKPLLCYRTAGKQETPLYCCRGEDFYQEDHVELCGRSTVSAISARGEKHRQPLSLPLISGQEKFRVQILQQYSLALD